MSIASSVPLHIIGELNNELTLCLYLVTIWWRLVTHVLCLWHCIPVWQHQQMVRVSLLLQVGTFIIGPHMLELTFNSNRQTDFGCGFYWMRTLNTIRQQTYMLRCMVCHIMFYNDFFIEKCIFLSLSVFVMLKQFLFIPVNIVHFESP